MSTLPETKCRRSFRLPIFVGMLGVLCVATPGSPAQGDRQLEAQAAQGTAGAEAAPVEEAAHSGSVNELPPENSETDEEQAARKTQQRAVTLGFLLLSGVVIVGLSLLGFVVVWGHRTRRLARSALPKTHPVDELWYLKPNRAEPHRKHSDPEPPPDESQD